MSSERSHLVASAYLEGVSVADILKRFNISNTTFDRYLKIQNVQRKRNAAWPEALEATVTKLWEAGVLSAAEIAKQVSTDAHPMTRSAIIGYAHRNKLKRPEGFKARPGGAMKPGPRAKSVNPPVKRAKSKRPPKPKYDPASGEMTNQAPDPKTTIPDISGVLINTDPQIWTRRSGLQCNWPVDGEGAETRYCCAPVKGSGSWCEEHRARGYKPFNGKGSYSDPKRYVEQTVRRARY